MVSEQHDPPAPPAKRVGVREFRGNFSGFMRQVRQGASFMVTSRDEVVAIVGPPPQAARPRRLAGGLRGQIWMAADFDTLPADIVVSMEGASLENDGD